MEGRAQHASSRGKRSFAMMKFLGLVSKRKRDEEKKRSDLSKAMQESSIERLAAVITSARSEFGDRLNDLCSEAERVLYRLMSQEEQHQGDGDSAAGTHRKVTLRERLLLADSEANATAPASVAASLPIEIEREVEPDAPPPPPPPPAPVLQAVLRLVRSSPGSEAQVNQAPTQVRGSLAQQLGLTTISSSSSREGTGSNGGRNLLGALLWDDRNVDDGWVAFGVSVEPMLHHHLDHPSRSQSMGRQLNRVDGPSSGHRPTSSLDGVAIPDENSTIPQTPSRASLMSLLSQAEEGGSSIIFMNRQLMQISPSREEQQQQQQNGLDQICCVCMGHQKGAAFIPCGHTFCRKCCREVRAARGSCPLCNKEISDILNLY